MLVQLAPHLYLTSKNLDYNYCMHTCAWNRLRMAGGKNVLLTLCLLPVVCDQVGATTAQPINLCTGAETQSGICYFKVWMNNIFTPESHEHFVLHRWPTGTSCLKDFKTQLMRPIWPKNIILTFRHFQLTVITSQQLTVGEYHGT